MTTRQQNTPDFHQRRWNSDGAAVGFTYSQHGRGQQSPGEELQEDHHHRVSDFGSASAVLQTQRSPASLPVPAAQQERQYLRSMLILDKGKGTRDGPPSIHPPTHPRNDHKHKS